MKNNELNIDNEQVINFKLVHQNFDTCDYAPAKHINKTKEFFKTIIKNKSFLAGLIMFSLIMFGTITFPLIWSNAEFRQPSIKNIPIFGQSNTQSHPNCFNFLGTDSQARDMWASLWTGLAFHYH